MGHLVFDYARPGTRRRFRPLVVVPGRISRPAGALSIVLALAAIPFFPLHTAVRSYNPWWYEWITPVLLCASLALVLIGLLPDVTRGRPGARDGLAGLVVSVGCLTYLLIAPRIIVCGERADRVKCASNLKQLGLAMLIYGNANGGALPPNLPTLYRSTDLTADAFVCPTSGDRVAHGPTTASISPRLAGKPYCSYIYVGAGLATSAPADAILAYEPASNHSGDGACVLFGDGHVEFVGAKQLPALLAPTTAPATRATSVGDSS